MTNNPSKNRRRKGEGNGSIYWRTITKNGKEYSQAYYHWQENGQKRTKYIPKKLLEEIQEAEAAKRPVVEILQLLGFVVSPSNLLGDNQINPSNNEILKNNSVIPNKLLGDKQINPSNDQLSEISPSNEISPSKVRRYKGEGSGSIHWRIITKNGKDYSQAYYHYEFWSEGERLVKSSKYIPKHLLKRVQQMEQEKAAVKEMNGTKKSYKLYSISITGMNTLRAVDASLRSLFL